MQSFLQAANSRYIPDGDKGSGPTPVHGNDG